MNTARQTNIIPISGKQQMNNQLPEPPVPEDCDLSGFPYLPLDATRFRDSTFVAESSLEAVGAACILWAAAWAQVPAGSLPDNDATLARMTGFGRDVESWMKIKASALYGFEKYADGRLYHKHLTTHVIRAWEKRTKKVSAAATSWIKRNKNKQEQSTCEVDEMQMNSECYADAMQLQSKEHKEHTENKDNNTPLPPHDEPKADEQEDTATASAFAGCVSDGFEKIWEAMPFPKVQKQDGLKAWRRVCRGKTAEQVQRGTELLIRDMTERADSVAGYESPFLKTHLSSYLSKKMWLDEEPPQRFGKLQSQGGAA